MLLLLSLSQAAELTYIPKLWRGDVTVGYGYGYQRGHLVEPDPDPAVEDHQVALALHNEHFITIGAMGTVLPGVAIGFEVPTWIAYDWAWTGASEMVYDPVNEQGSMLPGAELGGEVERYGVGPGGTWLRVRTTPFNEVFAERANRTTWAIEAAYRTPDAVHYQMTDADLGVGNGSGAWRISSAWSTHYGTSQPYLGVTFLTQKDTSVSLSDTHGVAVSPNALLNNPRRFNAITGVEVHTFENPETRAWFAVDFHTGFEYVEAHDTVSGAFLPSIMRTTDGKTVEMAEYSTVSGGIGLYWRMFRYAKLNLWGDVGYVMPHRLEDPYPILTGPDTVRVSAGVDLTMMVRTAQD